MRFLKAVDLYGKMPKGLAEPTSSGAVVSIITLVILSLLIMTEFIEYITIDVNSDIVVDDERSRDRVQINMDIKFLRAPCDFLELDAFDAMGQQLGEEHRRLHFYRLDSSENVIGAFKRDQAFDVASARVGIAERQGCQVSGYVKVNKVEGKLQFGPHRSHHYIANVGNLNFPLDYSHKIVHLSFGDEKELQKVKKLFTRGQLETLSNTERIKKLELAAVPFQHEHYISIVPTKYILLNKKSHFIYQYTANHNEVRAQYYPQVIFRYNISPVNVNFWQTKEDILHFLVQICAAIGGIFTVVGMIEGATHNIVRSVLKIN